MSLYTAITHYPLPITHYPLPITRSALHPRQTCRAPSALSIAMAGSVLVSLETFEHVVARGIAGLVRHRRGMMRTPAAAANEHHQRLLVDLLLELGKKSEVRLAARVGEELDFHCAGNAADPVPLGARAHIDQYRLRRLSPDLVSLAGQQRPLIRKSHLLRPRAGGFQYVIGGQTFSFLPLLRLIGISGAGMYLAKK
jgi:hypothetical protein